ncbi:MAG TPA: glutamate--tRNA ligase [Thermoanaerobaculia bacterium]|nr:glutamate--tRNA ligase [Thermoanaerobaculia bacterium]
MTVRVRFAPSPTGHLHVGGARTAIFNWLFARHHDGTFIIRVEDTDVARSTRESEEMVLEDLRWLGLLWDEGPDVGGPHGPYRQSERMKLYADSADELLAKGIAYRCFCDEATLEAKRSAAEEAGRPPHYDLTCYQLPAEEIQRHVAAGDLYALRFHVPKEKDQAAGDVTIHDLIRGAVTWRGDSLGDFIILRSDGMPIYNFCVVVDDHDMRITHVIRAEEHLTNTHRQVLIYRALGWEVPQFAHVSLILGQDRSKLSKRHGATSVAAYAADGFLPEAMVNYLTLLGWTPPDGQEIFSRDSAAREFSLERVHAAAAVFDPQKFAWLNGQYIQKTANIDLLDAVALGLSAPGWLRERSAAADEWIVEAIELVKKGATQVTGIALQLAFFFEWNAAAVVREPANAEVLADPGALGLIQALAEDLAANGAPRDSDQYHALADRLKQTTGRKGKGLFMPIRIATMGSTHGPELQRALPLMERGSEIPEFKIVAPLERTRQMLAEASRS